MKRHKPEPFKRHEIGLMILTLAVAAFLMIVPEIMGATVYRNLVIGNASTDTVYVVRRDASDSTLIDSTIFDAGGSFPRDTLYTWSDAIDYDIRFVNVYNGAQYPWSEFVKFTGAAATVDYTIIADSVWRRQQVRDGDTVSGSYGSYLDAKITSITGGTGIYDDTIVVWDSTNGQVVPGAQIVVWNDAQSATLATGVTTAAGEYIAGLSSGDTVRIRTTASGYTFTVADDNFYVGGNQSDTIFCYAFVPGAPTGDSTCRVDGYIQDDPSAATVTVEGKQVTFTTQNDVFDICNGRAIQSNTVATYSDSTGYFFKDLTFSSCLAKYGDTAAPATPITYSVSIQDGKQGYIITVPDTSNYTITWR